MYSYARQMIRFALLSLSFIPLSNCSDPAPISRLGQRASPDDTETQNSDALSRSKTPDQGAPINTRNETSSADTPNGVSFLKSKILGTNLAELKDWSGEYPFVDAMKASRGWFSGNANQWTTTPPTPINMDSNGGVLSLTSGQWLRTRILQGNVTGSPIKNCEATNGEYTVLYSGEATFMAFEGAKINAAKSTPGKLIVDFDCLKGSLDLAVVGITANRPLTDMKVIMPGGSCRHDETMYCKTNSDCGGASTCELFTENYASRPFHPKFLGNIKNYASIRFMDWMLTNNSTQKEWTNRPRESHLRWSEKGIPLEVMIRLVNLLDADPWFNIPEGASDDYVANFARVVKSGLEPGRKATIEYSNEVWNGIFSSNRYVIAQGTAQNLGGRTAFENGMRFYSKRAVQIFNIFTREMGGNDRITRVLAGQAANLGVAMAILNFENAFQSADAYAIAPYFHSSELSEGQLKISVTEALTHLRTHAVPEAIGWVKNHMNYLAQIAATPQNGRKLDLIAYEGGQHLVSSIAVRDDATKASIQTLLDDINRHDDMKGLYLDYLSGWKAAGGKSFVHFNNAQQYSKAGRWGSMENQFAPKGQSPKYDALMQFISDGN